MIACNLRVLLAERNLTSSKVSEETGISRTTLGSLMSGKAQGLQFDTLNKLCSYLSVDIGSILVYAPYDLYTSSVDIQEKTVIFKLDKRDRTQEFEMYLEYAPKDRASISEYFCEKCPIPYTFNVFISSNSIEQSTAYSEFYLYYDRLPQIMKMGIIDDTTYMIKKEMYKVFNTDRKDESDIIEIRNIHINLNIEPPIMTFARRIENRVSYSYRGKDDPIATVNDDGLTDDEALMKILNVNDIE